jgi:SPP1 family predicted phage head-tail adaptor
MNKRIEVLNRKVAEDSDFGLDGSGVEWETTCTLWAAVDFVKGVRAMREGAIDVYGVVMVRLRYTDKINARSRIRYHGELYNILPETFHDDYQANAIQFNAQLILES